MSKISLWRSLALASLCIFSSGLLVSHIASANVTTVGFADLPSQAHDPSTGTPYSYGARIYNPRDGSSEQGPYVSVTAAFGEHITGDGKPAGGNGSSETVTAIGSCSIDGNEVAQVSDTYTFTSNYTWDWYEDKVIGDLPVAPGVHYVTAAGLYSIDGGALHNMANDHVYVTTY